MPKLLLSSAAVGCGLALVAFAADPQPTTQPARPPATTQPAASPADSAAPAATTQPATAPALRCPVTGKPIDRQFVERFRGRWVYFATADAQKKFAADPYEYLDAVREQWEADRPLRIQVRCPVTAKPIDPTVFVGQGEEALYFASEEARQEWTEATPQRQAELRGRLESCSTYQTGCATCSMLINPVASKTVDGRTIYFCCMGCGSTFDENKAEYLKKVDEQIETNRAAWRAREKRDK